MSDEHGFGGIIGSPFAARARRGPVISRFDDAAAAGVRMGTRERKSRRATWIAALLLLGACGWGSESARLRVTNAGSVPIRNLTLLFPEDQIAFGDIAVGATTKYTEAPHGVFRYAAYRFEVDGAIVTQPVIDWVGEVPIEGESFTYSLATDGQRIELVDVTRDN